MSICDDKRGENPCPDQNDATTFVTDGESSSSSSSTSTSSSTSLSLSSQATTTRTNNKKRSKTTSIFDNTSVLSSDLFSQRDMIRQNYTAKSPQKPYPHSQILNVFDPQFLVQLKEEIKWNSKVHFKESDLFRVYQSIDLANLSLSSEEALTMNLDISKLPCALQLRDIFYSQEWRSFMEYCSGLKPGTLIDKIDCACNCHTPGCHLLCHDDVIGTRKLSYILYLTEPDWNATTEGGQLELYDTQQQEEEEEQNEQEDKSSASSSSSSAVIPSSLVEPLFNSLAFFEVVPGQSYHAVQEVIGKRPRLSLQGWYHAKEPPKDIEKATLNELIQKKEKSATTDTAAAAAVVSKQQQQQQDSNTDTDDDMFTEQDRTYLQKYITHEYLTEQSMKEIRIKFENDSSVQFRNFLVEQWVPNITSCWEEDTDDTADTTDNNNDHDNDNEEQKPSAVVTKEVSDNDDDGNDKNKKNDDLMARYTKGVTSEWKLRGPAHKQRYLRYNNINNINKNNSSSNENENEDTDNNEENRTGRLLQTVKKQVFASEAFLRYLTAVTSLEKPTSILGNDHDNDNDNGGGEIRRFRPGMDYTVAHYGLLQDESLLDATMCFVSSDTEEKQCLWECGDVGGFECYIEADLEEEDDNDNDNENDDIDDERNDPQEDREGDDDSTGVAAAGTGTGTGRAAGTTGRPAADEYQEEGEEDDTKLLSVSACQNTLSLVYRDPGTMRFVKYLSASAPSSRYDICMEYALPPDTTDTDDTNDTNNANNNNNTEECDNDDNDDDDDGEELVDMKVC